MRRLRVEFEVFSDIMDLDVIRNGLGISPVWSIRKGEHRTPGRGRPARENAFVLREDMSSDSDYLSDLLERLFDTVIPLRKSLLELASDGCKAKLSIVGEVTEAGDASFSLNQSWIALLSDVGGFVDVDLFDAR